MALVKQTFVSSFMKSSRSQEVKWSHPMVHVASTGFEPPGIESDMIDRINQMTST